MKLSKFAATLAASFGFLAASAANATVIQVDGNGGTDTFTQAAQLKLTPVGVGVIDLNLGADGIFSSGDAFSELITYNITGVTRPNGTFALPQSFTSGYDANGDQIFNFTVQAVLSGYVTGVTNPDILSGSPFGVVFNGGSLTVSNLYASGPVAQAAVVSGGSTSFDASQNPTGTLQFGLSALFTSLDSEYFQTVAGGSLEVFLPLVFGVADASANLLAVSPPAVGADGNAHVTVTVLDNGGTASIEIPEPASIALVGIALLGAGVSGRRFKAKKTA